MSDSPQVHDVEAFYDTHPITERQIVEKLKTDGVDLSSLTEDRLQDYDQDHYGGVAANDALAAIAAIDQGCDLLDVCCGLGGPSRYLAHKFGCRVTGIDLTKSRIEGATRLTAMAGLADRVSFRCANALDLPFSDERSDVVLSQEAFCHIPDTDRIVAECVRVLKPGGRMAFTDVLVTDRTTAATEARLQREMAMTELASADFYRQCFESEGCDMEVEDLSDAWRGILIDRLAMYRGLKAQTIERFGSAHFTKWDRAYSFFVGLYGTGELGGGRFLARRRD